MVEEAVDKDLSKDLPTGGTFPKSPEEKTSQDQGSERRRVFYQRAYSCKTYSQAWHSEEKDKIFDPTANIYLFASASYQVSRINHPGWESRQSP